nr:hypothetical transcript [Hymenolepis microstoma]
MKVDDSIIDSLMEHVWEDQIDEYHEKALKEWCHPLSKLNAEGATYDVLKTFEKESGLKIISIPCDECNFECKKYDKLFRHMALNHRHIQLCPCCQIQIGDYFEFLTHLKVSHDVLYTCPSCFSTFDERRLLDVHYDITHGNGINKFCFRCQKLFRTLNGYKHHCKAVHGEPEPVLSYNCEYCDRSFASAEALASHLPNMHGDSHGEIF